MKRSKHGRRSWNRKWIKYVRSRRGNVEITDTLTYILAIFPKPLPKSWSLRYRLFSSLKLTTEL